MVLHCTASLCESKTEMSNITYRSMSKIILRYLGSRSNISEQHASGCSATFSVFQKAYSLFGCHVRDGAVDELESEVVVLCLIPLFNRLIADARSPDVRVDSRFSSPNGL